LPTLPPEARGRRKKWDDGLEAHPTRDEDKSLVADLRWVSAWAGVVGLSLSWSAKRAAARALASGSMMAVLTALMRSKASRAAVKVSDSRVVASSVRDRA